MLLGQLVSEGVIVLHLGADDALSRALLLLKRDEVCKCENGALCSQRLCTAVQLLGAVGQGLARIADLLCLVLVDDHRCLVEGGLLLELMDTTDILVAASETLTREGFLIGGLEFFRIGGDGACVLVGRGGGEFLLLFTLRGGILRLLGGKEGRLNLSRREVERLTLDSRFGTVGRNRCGELRLGALYLLLYRDANDSGHVGAALNAIAQILRKNGGLQIRLLQLQALAIVCGNLSVNLRSKLLLLARKSGTLSNAEHDAQVGDLLSREVESVSIQGELLAAILAAVGNLLIRENEDIELVVLAPESLEDGLCLVTVGLEQILLLLGLTVLGIPFVLRGEGS